MPTNDTSVDGVAALAQALRDFPTEEDCGDPACEDCDFGRLCRSLADRVEALVASEQTLRERVRELEACETCAAMTGERDRAIKERDSARIALAAANKIIGLRDEAAHVEHLRTQLAAAEHLLDRMIADAAAPAATHAHSDCGEERR